MIASVVHGGRNPAKDRYSWLAPEGVYQKLMVCEKVTPKAQFQEMEGNQGYNVPIETGLDLSQPCSGGLVEC